MNQEKASIIIQNFFRKLVKDYKDFYESLNFDYRGGVPPHFNKYPNYETISTNLKQ